MSRSKIQNMQFEAKVGGGGVVVGSNDVGSVPTEL